MFCLFILWLLIICTLALDWHRCDFNIFVYGPGISLDVGDESFVESSVPVAVDNILSVLVIIIADGLLVSLYS